MTEFIPASFASVDTMAKGYFKAERRWVDAGPVPLKGQDMLTQYHHREAKA